MLTSVSINVIYSASVFGDESIRDLKKVVCDIIGDGACEGAKVKDEVRTAPSNDASSFYAVLAFDLHSANTISENAKSMTQQKAYAELVAVVKNAIRIGNYDTLDFKTQDVGTSNIVFN